MKTYKEHQEINNADSTVEKKTKNDGDEYKHLAYDIMRKIKMKTINKFTKMKGTLKTLLARK